MHVCLVWGLPNNNSYYSFIKEKWPNHLNSTTVFLQAVACNEDLKTCTHMNKYIWKEKESFCYHIQVPYCLKNLASANQKMEFKHKLSHCYRYSLISSENRALCMLLNMSSGLERETMHIRMSPVLIFSAWFKIKVKVIYLF